MELINMTTHSVHLVSLDGTRVLTVPPSGKTVKLNPESHWITDIEVQSGAVVGLIRTTFCEPEGLPAIGDAVDVLYIVSPAVKSSLPGRADLVVPAEPQRDTEGQITGYLSLSWL